MATFEDFQKLDIRVGRILSVEDFPRARKPFYKLTIDFGDEIGIKRSAAQITDYNKEELKGIQIVAVVNFPPKNIAGFTSEVLVLGVPTPDGELSLLVPKLPAQIGGKVY